MNSTRVHASQLVSSKTPGRSGVTTFADGEVISTKGALSIVTSHAALGPTRGVMVQRLRCGDLPALGLTGTDLVALIAIQLFMFRMTEPNAESRHHFRGA